MRTNVMELGRFTATARPVKAGQLNYAPRERGKQRAIIVWVGHSCPTCLYLRARVKGGAIYGLAAFVAVARCAMIWSLIFS